jgi:pimeloyl-ACP methyl ester carboxylesterase
MSDRDPSRARRPDGDGFAERDGVRVFYERFGRAGPAVLLLPTWSIVHARCWKMQVPYLARHGRVVTFDPRGNGRSDRPRDPEAYAEREFAGDALAVLEATALDRAVVVGWSVGAQRALLLADAHPERVAGIAFIGPTLPPTGARRARRLAASDYGDFVRWFFPQVYTDPHSTKQIEDSVGWAEETTADTVIATTLAPAETSLRAAAARVRCPVLVVHGSGDAISPHATGAELAELTGGSLVTLEGAGHAPHARHPVVVNLLLRDFARRCAADLI